MRLADWMALKGMSDTQLADALGVDRSSVTKWRRGTVPTPQNISAVRELTDGAVRPDDWFPAEESAA